MIDEKRVEYLVRAYSELIDARGIEHFCCQNLQKVPRSWREHSSEGGIAPLSLLCLEELLRESSYDRRAVQNPSEVHCFLCPPSCSSHSVPETFPLCSSTSSTRMRVKQKKQHELDRVVELVKQLQNIVDVDSVVDVGAGIGHLSRIIALFTNLKVFAIEGDEKFTIAAEKMDAKRKLETEPVRFTSLVTVQLAERIDEMVQKGAIIVGLHACGDLSTTIADVFRRSKKAKALILAGCCYHKQFQCFQFYREANPEDEFDPTSSEENGVFPVSVKWKNVRFSYLARELACHINEKRKFNPENYAISARAHLEKFIRAAVGAGEEHNNMGLCGVKIEKETVFEDYVRKAMARRGNSYLELVLKYLRNNHPDILRKHVTDMSDDWIERIDLLRCKFAPIIESAIVDDRMEFLSEAGCTTCVIPLFDPTISPRNLVIVSRK